MKITLVYCERCRETAYLEKSKHFKVNARCELCGRAGITAYVWSYSKSRIKRAIEDIRFWLRQEERLAMEEVESLKDSLEKQANQSG